MDRAQKPDLEGFRKALKKSLDVLCDFNSIRIISHYDADGICSAGVFYNVLLRMGKQPHASLIRDLTPEFIQKLKGERYGAYAFLDMGSSNIDEIESMSAEAVIYDHHAPIKGSEKKMLVNSHNFGIDGTFECCASTIAYEAGKAASEKNADLVGIALAGIIGDRQNVGGFRGLNRNVLDEGIRNGHVKEMPQMNLYGENVLDAVEGSNTPFLKGISGRPKEASEFLDSFGIQKTKRMDELTKQEGEKLLSAITTRLLHQGARPETIEELVEKRYWLTKENADAEEYSHYINSCGRLDKPGLGLSVCLGDKGALEAAKKLRNEYRKRITECLIKLEGGIEPMKSIQYFVSDDHALSGALAGIGMLYLFDQGKATIAISRAKDELKVSGRGTEHLVSSGLDLSSALRESSAKFGGRGGGHSIASGANLPLAAEKDFLAELDAIVSKQLRPTGKHK